MRRREFLALTAVSAWPFAALAQQPRRVIGSLGGFSANEANGYWVAAFLRGLKDTGYVEGRDITIEYRWAEGQYERLPALATELVSRGVAAIVAFDAPSAVAAKSVSRTIPIVFVTGADPVKLGLVESLNRPGGNLTGATGLLVLAPKQLEVLRELLPGVKRIAFLVNPRNQNVGADIPGTPAAAHALALHLDVLTASTDRDLEVVFTSMVEQRTEALIVMPDPFFIGRRDKLIALAARYTLPVIYPMRDFVAVGGLISYGSAVADVFRDAGTQTGKILGGAKPADLPVQQNLKFELLINLKTAKALGITIPSSLLARADEVIE
jgi:putative tryptophan/tyrosine transport system substrate-binding protein